MRPITTVVLLGVLRSLSAAAPLYGTGPHWVDRVRSGYAAFGARASVGVDLTFDGAVDFEVAMTGTTEVFRGAARATDPRHPRHPNHIDLEIVAMHLAGELPGLGSIALHNVTPLRVVAVIDRLPPIGSTFTLEGSPVAFVDEAGSPIPPGRHRER